jgi:hypothetical protein
MQSVIEGAREVVAPLQGWKHIWAIFLAREDPGADPPEERWKGIIRGGPQLTDRELLTMVETLFIGKEEDGLSRFAALRQLAAHSREIAKAFGIPDNVGFPRTANEVARFEAEQLKPQVKQKILQALQRRGIRGDELWRWLRRNMDLNIEWTEKNDNDQ